MHLNVGCAVVDMFFPFFLPLRLESSAADPITGCKVELYHNKLLFICEFQQEYAVMTKNDSTTAAQTEQEQQAVDAQAEETVQADENVQQEQGQVQDDSQQRIADLELA